MAQRAQRLCQRAVALRVVDYVRTHQHIEPRRVRGVQQPPDVIRIPPAQLRHADAARRPLLGAEVALEVALGHEEHLVCQHHLRRNAQARGREPEQAAAAAELYHAFAGDEGGARREQPRQRLRRLPDVAPRPAPEVRPCPRPRVIETALSRPAASCSNSPPGHRPVQQASHPTRRAVK